MTLSSNSKQQQQQQQGAGIKRWKTVKQVLLYRGNLVLDCPIPPRLLNQLPHGERDEFTHMRYTAATCDPSDFYNENFTLRQRLFSKPRQTELFIVVTMYNEDEILFARTMIGVLKNVEYMCKRNESKTWGKDAWKKIVVCVVSDGRAKINPRTKALLAGMGVYQEGIAKQQVNGKDVTAHIYEYTTQVGLAIKNDVVQLVTTKQQPVQMLFCLKEKNQKKINSHRWFFQAFGRVLDPNICVLIDAGTKPGGSSIYHLLEGVRSRADVRRCLRRDQGHVGARRKEPSNPLVATAEFRVQDEQHPRQAPRVGLWVHLCAARCLLGIPLHCAAERQERPGPLEKYFAGEKLAGCRRRHLHGQHVSCRGSYPLLRAGYQAQLPLDPAVRQVRHGRDGRAGYGDRSSSCSDVAGSTVPSSPPSMRIVHFHQFFRSDHSVFRKLCLLHRVHLQHHQHDLRLVCHR